MKPSITFFVLVWLVTTQIAKGKENSVPRSSCWNTRTKLIIPSFLDVPSSKQKTNNIFWHKTVVLNKGLWTFKAILTQIWCPMYQLLIYPNSTEHAVVAISWPPTPNPGVSPPNWIYIESNNPLKQQMQFHNLAENCICNSFIPFAVLQTTARQLPCSQIKAQAKTDKNS